MWLISERASASAEAWRNRFGDVAKRLRRSNVPAAMAARLSSLIGSWTANRGLGLERLLLPLSRQRAVVVFDELLVGGRGVV